MAAVPICWRKQVLFWGTLFLLTLSHTSIETITRWGSQVIRQEYLKSSPEQGDATIVM